MACTGVRGQCHNDLERASREVVSTVVFGSGHDASPPHLEPDSGNPAYCPSGGRQGNRDEHQSRRHRDPAQRRGVRATWTPAPAAPVAHLGELLVDLPQRGCPFGYECHMELDEEFWRHLAAVAQVFQSLLSNQHRSSGIALVPQMSYMVQRLPSAALFLVIQHVSPFPAACDLGARAAPWQAAARDADIAGPSPASANDL
jgi:hypothetical protein